MKLSFTHDNRGIALVIVMLVIVVFAILAGGFAYSMKVETKLARNATWETELEWLGRSGVELAKYVLSQPGQSGAQYDALNQKWAGGTGETNDVLANISLTDNQLGHGRFSIKIVDAERKFNINLAAQYPELLQQALILMGIDAVESPSIVNAIADWIDRDDNGRAGSSDTESSYYLSLKPPYSAKNGPIDDLTELMLVKGITPGMYWGSGAGGGAASQRYIPMANRFNRRTAEEPVYPIGFVDLFTTISLPTININTTSATVLQLIPEVDENMAQAILQTRAGPDGAEGNEDDMPFRSVGEIRNVPGMTQPMAQMFAKYFNTRSSTFEVEVDAEVNQFKRKYYALLRRPAVGQPPIILSFYWK